MSYAGIGPQFKLGALRPASLFSPCFLGCKNPGTYPGSPVSLSWQDPLFWPLRFLGPAQALAFSKELLEAWEEPVPQV